LSDWQSARYERKFPVPELGQADLEPFLRLHRLAFRERYAPRQVNNIYLDTADLRCFHDNVAGASRRFKPRLRWYGESVPMRLAVDGEGKRSTGMARAGFESDPKLTLEIKRKQGHLGIKDSWTLGELPVDQILATAWALCSGQKVASSDDPTTRLPERLRSDLRAMRSVLYNRYRRRYFLSADGRFRLTLDHRMAFRQILSGPDGPPGRAFRASGSVIELKYAAEDDERLRRMLVDFPFRMARSSKYVSGIRACWR
jgi:hypothetical protein